MVNADVAEVSSDVLLLKHAGGFYGADKSIAARLVTAKVCSQPQLAVGPDDYVVIDAKNAVQPARVLFLGTAPLHSFGYPEMEHFGECAIDVLSKAKIPVNRLTTTIHGAGYGLDAEESLQRLVQGFRSGLMLPDSPRIQEIVFVEADRRRAHLLTTALANIPPAENHPAKADLAPSDRTRVSKPVTGVVRTESDSNAVLAKVETNPKKRHVFVAMPFSEDFEDVYEYGIYGPVRECGLICEKTSESAYTGDILHRIKERIETADYVVAELTGGRPNVYLEVGYAWGKGVPVIFLARSGEQLHFDVTRHRCIYYKSIRQLAKDLEKLLRGLSEQE